MVAGHSHPAVVEAVRRQAGLGQHLGAESELAADWAERIIEPVPSAERVRFTSSGTEATLLALRVAPVASPAVTACSSLPVTSTAGTTPPCRAWRCRSPASRPWASPPNAHP